jgi:hypothetical protein
MTATDNCQELTDTFLPECHVAHDDEQPDAQLAGRMFEATNRLELTERRKLTLDEIGARIADHEEGRDVPYSASVVRRWLAAEQEPRYRTLQLAIAKALGVDPGWLWFGQDSAAPMVSAANAPRPPGLRKHHGNQPGARSDDAKKRAAEGKRGS